MIQFNAGQNVTWMMSDNKVSSFIFVSIEMDALVSLLKFNVIIVKFSPKDVSQLNFVRNSFFFPFFKLE